MLVIVNSFVILLADTNRIILYGLSFNKFDKFILFNFVFV